MTTTTEIAVTREDLIRATCDALESGAYAQDRHALHTGNGWCCLGVMTDQARRLGVVQGEWRESPASEEEGRVLYEFAGAGDLDSGDRTNTVIRTLPYDISAFVGLDRTGHKKNADKTESTRLPIWRVDTRHTYASLSSANDAGVPFPLIAAALRRHFLGDDIPMAGSESSDVSR